MQTDPIATIVAQLSMLFGADAARFAGAAMVLIIVIAHGVMPWITVASPTSPVWYRRLYAVLKVIAGNYGNATPQVEKS